MTAPDDPALAAPAWRDRWAARRASLRAGRTARRRLPEPFPTGDAERGAALLDGRAGSAAALGTVADGVPSWDAPAASPAAEAARQRFEWLDDLAALGTVRARSLAGAWTAEWLGRQGSGQGAGWTVPRATARLARLMGHAEWLGQGDATGRALALDRSYAVHLRFLSARLDAALAEMANRDALGLAAGAVAAAAGLDGGHVLRERAQRILETRAEAAVGSDGGIAERCPEVLAEAFVALAWAARALETAGLDPLPAHRAALTRMAPALRALRHHDGGLPRFHGGGAGEAARLDAALATLPRAGAGGVAPAAPMGFAVLKRGRTSLAVDAAAPPAAAAPRIAHASTGGVEVTVGRHPLIVQCGPGAAFGADWRAASRRTPSHSTLVLNGASSARFVEAGAPPLLRDGPQTVETEADIGGTEARLTLAHDGYAARFGLIHVRRLSLSLDGGVLRGEDLLSAVTEEERRRFARACAELAGGVGAGLPFAVRFHLHPAVSAHAEEARNRVALRLPGGDRWAFAPGEGVTMRLDPGIYLENTRADPVPCQQIVLHGRARRAATAVTWRLHREEGQPAFRRQSPRTDDTSQ